ncbi:hypothetical protein HNY73_020970 [Argiope bruennichi]|uniref:Uncharacterized protein n=1 Tax=Argiope bruennichi TaxID=94029 RepID=A0A8T0E9K8_ARGBR|nr:hypothetical protein HNY73_020970 [Argiope bruennichi]
MTSSAYLTFIVLSVLAIIYTVASESLDQDGWIFLLQKSPLQTFYRMGKRSNLRGSDAPISLIRQATPNSCSLFCSKKMAESTVFENSG